MQYNRLGKAGIRVSELSFGSWVTFSKQLGVNGAKELMQAAFEHGINFFDNAEAYAAGKAEEIMGEGLKGFPREQLVISTKLYFGKDTPNESRTLSRKHLMEGIDNSLKRLQLDYVDLLFCHRPDPNTPIEETVRAMDQIIRDGKAFYWGTSEWSAKQIESAYQIAADLNCMPPTMEQPEYNMFYRHNVERNLLPLYEKYGLGTTIWSPLASGVLTGKYSDGIPKDSRMAQETWLQDNYLTQARVNIAKQLELVAKQLDCSLAQLAVAWCLKNPNVSTVILGASHLAQLQENLKSLEVKDVLTDDIMQTIEDILVDYQETERPY